MKTALRVSFHVRVNSILSDERPPGLQYDDFSRRGWDPGGNFFARIPLTGAWKAFPSLPRPRLAD